MALVGMKVLAHIPCNNENTNNWQCLEMNLPMINDYCKSADHNSLSLSIHSRNGTFTKTFALSFSEIEMVRINYCCETLRTSKKNIVMPFFPGLRVHDEAFYNYLYLYMYTYIYRFPYGIHTCQFEEIVSWFAKRKRCEKKQLLRQHLCFCKHTLIFMNK